LKRLSNRELEVFRLVGTGLSSAQIAESLHISTKTVETHRARIKEKLGIETAGELVVKAATWVNGGAPA
jgi:DNA-binding CsgD family transcriptional regulator